MVSQKFVATAVVRNNSIDFVDQILALNKARQPLVLVSDAEKAGSLPGIEIDRCIEPGTRTGWYEASYPLIDEDSPAQVSYTSGTEGEPKGILLSYANLADAAERIIDQMQMTAEIREYVGVPATFSFGMGRFRAISAVGGRAYMPPRGFDPLEFARMLSAGEVNALAAVPTLLRILLDASEVVGKAGQKLRWMEIGSQHMTAEEKRRIRELFPNARIVQHYGLTEASRTTFLDVSGVAPEMLESVGRPVGKTEVALGEDGRIQIRGPHVAKARIDAGGLHDLRDAEGWLHTSDLGHMQDGYLFFDGRADDIINCGGIKVSPDQLEDRIRADLEDQVPIAVAKIPDPQRGDGILVAVQGDSSALGRIKELASAALLKDGIAAGSSLQVIAVDELPVTGTGKVQRPRLAEMFTSRQKPVTAQDKRAAKASITNVLALFGHEFPGQEIRQDSTFQTLGGDSLHFIQFSLAFEQKFGALPDGWEHLTVADLQNHADTHRRSIWRRLEPATFTRAFFMICIVALHTDAFVYSSNWGAAYFLVLLAGYSVARFQLPEIIRTGSVSTLIGTIKFVAIPTVLMVALLQVMTHRFEILPLLLVSNYLDPYTLKGFAFYFMEFYIQLLVLATIFFSFEKVRHAFGSYPMLSALGLLVTVAALNHLIDMNWDTNYNYHRTPLNYAWPFALGIVIAMAKDTPTKVLALGVAILAAYLKWDWSSASYYVIAACALLIFVKHIYVPAPVKVVVGEIANASMFVYLCHYQIMSIVKKIYGHPLPWVSLIVSIIVGIIVMHCYVWFAREASRLWKALRKQDRLAAST